MCYLDWQKILLTLHPLCLLILGPHPACLEPVPQPASFCMQPPVSLGPTSETAGLTSISLLQSALDQLVYNLPALGLLAHCLSAMSRQTHCLPVLNPLNGPVEEPC